MATIQFGFEENARMEIASILDEAFEAKFRFAIPNKDARIRIFARSLVPEYTLVATVEKQSDQPRIPKSDSASNSVNPVLGVLGIKMSSGSFLDNMSLPLLVEELGFLRAIKALAILMLFDTQAKQSDLWIDEVAVARSGRGQGIGTKLIDRVNCYGEDNHFENLKLSVIDTNPQAKALYHKLGFEVYKEEEFKWLKPFIGFGKSFSMVKPLMSLSP